METRTSNALDQFCASLEERPGQSILDLASANQGTISYITGLGHKFRSEDFLMDLEQCFGAGEDSFELQADPQRAEEFLKAALDFPPESFDGVLLWDVIESLSEELLPPVIAAIHRVMKPSAMLLALFHTEEAARKAMPASYRIQDRKVMGVVPRGKREAAQFYSNRTLEKIFAGFGSVKFFLARDYLREVLVRK